MTTTRRTTVRSGIGLRESRARSLAKAVSWRVVGTLDTLLLSFLILTFLSPLFGVRESATAAENMELASYIAVTEVITKTLLFFVHERAWARFRWAIGTNRDGHHIDGLRRSTVKAASWRVIASLDTALLALIFTGHMMTALSIGGAEVATKLVLYVLHERVWMLVPFGRARSAAVESAGE
jgi:uncharacterized membrane protein